MGKALTDLALDLSTHRYDKETDEDKMSEFIDTLADVAIDPGRCRFAVKEPKVSAVNEPMGTPEVRIEITGFDFEKLNEVSSKEANE